MMPESVMVQFRKVLQKIKIVNFSSQTLLVINEQKIDYVLYFDCPNNKQNSNVACIIKDMYPTTSSTRDSGCRPSQKKGTA